MSDIDKVITALECRKNADKRCGNPCEELGMCHYATAVRDINGEIYRPFICDRERICTDAIILLKEQKAKQIIRKQCKKEHEDGSIDYFAEWYCPHCNSLIQRGFDAPWIKFCYKCGKPVLWEGR